MDFTNLSDATRAPQALDQFLQECHIKRQRRAQAKLGTTSGPAIGEGLLRRALKLAAKSAGANMPDLCPMSAKTDPFLLDTPANHRNALWCAAALTQYAPDRAIHPRGFHYILISVPGGVLMPGRYGGGADLELKTYQNTPECYGWLIEALRSARWLGYIPWDRIIDERNATGEIGVGMCWACCDKRDSAEKLRSDITAKLRNYPIPDLRVIPNLMAAAGHA